MLNFLLSVRSYASAPEESVKLEVLNRFVDELINIPGLLPEKMQITFDPKGTYVEHQTFLINRETGKATLDRTSKLSIGHNYQLGFDAIPVKNVLEIEDASQPEASKQVEEGEEVAEFIEEQFARAEEEEGGITLEQKQGRLKDFQEQVIHSLGQIGRAGGHESFASVCHLESIAIQNAFEKIKDIGPVDIVIYDSPLYEPDGKGGYKLKHVASEVILISNLNMTNVIFRNQGLDLHFVVESDGIERGISYNMIREIQIHKEE